MQVQRRDDWIFVHRITGPTHNWLGLWVEPGPPTTTPPVDMLDSKDGCSHAPLDGELIRRAVHEGVAHVNAERGTDLQVRGIRVRSGDTGPETIYNALAVYAARHALDEPRA